jgi:phage baseplate assembly protein V
MDIEELLAEVSELSRRLSNMLRYGRISAVDLAKGLVRVESGDIRTDWLPFFARAAGKSRSWEPPVIGEQCMVLSPGGDLTLGCALRGLYSDTYDQPSDLDDLLVTETGDGFSISYDSASNILSLTRQDGLKIQVKATSISFETDKAEIKNSTCSLIPTLAEMAEIIATSKTPTMMGDRESIGNSTQLPPLKEKLESFVG